MSALADLIPFLTGTQDKALKKEAIQKGGRADTPLLKAWLNHYEAQATTAAGSAPDFHERKWAALRARVATRKACLDALMDLCRRVLKESARKWPRPRCHMHHKENQCQDQVRLRQQEEAAHEQKARATRVEHLMALQAGGRRT
ncbi:hypothetical protein DFH07DRAFT_784675 [Mycena maculata]|uniref:Uncharacterized protein n=1 Tax=Mycena maculata TaxID=230809 RepID=A0AAD7MJB6_9AGAR|nr:hypothetical protein DFH07DRAFT_784675 [Mycena maculata]